MTSNDRKGREVEEERFIIKVVEMHYKQGLSQQEIGKKLKCIKNNDIKSTGTG